MSSLADNPEAEAEAVKFAVSPQIHAEDFLYKYMLDQIPEPDRDKARARMNEYYFFDGNRSAVLLDDLIRQHHPAAASRRLSLLEFASGYGLVSRHLRKMDERYDLVACDIHPQAIDFLREQLGVNAVLSCADPRDFDAKGKFDIVFALSFFSHMPDRTFGAWIMGLFETLADDGLLIFTTHGRVAYETDRPALEPAGYVFWPGSEQKDIPADEYGVTIATAFYVMDQIARCSCAAVVLFREGYWWESQDLFIVRKVRTDFRPSRAEVHASLATVQKKPEGDDGVSLLRSDFAGKFEQQANEIAALAHMVEEGRAELASFRHTVETSLGIGWEEIKALKRHANSTLTARLRRAARFK